MRNILFALLFVFLSSIAVAEPLPRCKPSEVALNETTLAKIDTFLEPVLKGEGTLAGAGCVVCIGRHGKIVFLKGYGDKNTDMAFEIYSMTKCVVTATSIMILAEQNKLSVDDPVAKYLTEFDVPDKRAITLRHLLTHTGGFPRYCENGFETMEKILTLKPKSEPGKAYNYSDPSFIMLGEIVKRISGKNVDEFAKENIFKPLGMNDSSYLPNDKLDPRVPPRPTRKPGQPSSPVAIALGYSTGHSGLVSTADDLAVYAAMMLNGGEFGGQRIMKSDTVKKMTTPNTLPDGFQTDKPTTGGTRGLGWAMQNRSVSACRPTTASPESFGHGGFLGTAFWMEPKYDMFMIFLTSSGNKVAYPLASAIGDIAIESVIDK
ncbi:MAG: beta-lactamase family protein [Planctomycetaceae bacterium]|nr:beta-lactamase family protein [Planctomycetaceae bacterium]